MSKVVHILRGPSGCGKSTIAGDILSKIGAHRSVICSADDFFMVGGEYEFNPRKLPEAHSFCMSRFLNAIERGVECIIVDNTNIRPWKYENYAQIAELSGYDVNIESVIVETVDEMRACARRNSHDVPLESIAIQAVNFVHDKFGHERMMEM